MKSSGYDKQYLKGKELFESAYSYTQMKTLQTRYQGLNALITLPNSVRVHRL